MFILNLFISTFLFSQNEIRSNAQLDKLLIKDSSLFQMFDTIFSNIEKDTTICRKGYNYIYVSCENNYRIKFEPVDSIFDFELDGYIIYKDIYIVFSNCRKKLFFTIDSSNKKNFPVYNYVFDTPSGEIIIIVDNEELFWMYEYNNGKFKFIEYQNTYKKER